MGYPVAKNNSAVPLLFMMVQSSDHVTPKTSATATVTISKNGAAFATPIGAVTEIGAGWYQVASNTTDAGTLGILLLHATASGADPTDEEFTVVDYAPTQVVVSSPTQTSGPTVTALDLITDALTELGALGDGETPSSASSAVGLRVLNRMIDNWATQRLSMNGVQAVTKVLTSGTQTYTMGTGGAINTARPVWIQSASLLWTASTPNVSTPIDLLTAAQWHAIAVTDVDGPPMYLYNDQAFPLSTLSLYPNPNASTFTLQLVVPVAIANFADLSTSYAFPPGVNEALVYGLALRLSAPFGKIVTPSLAEQAFRSFADLKRTNLVPLDMALHVPGIAGVAYDITSDT